MRLPLRRIALAAASSGAIGLVARGRGSLTTSGTVGALLTGTGIAGVGGWDWGAALVYFFVSSSALSRLGSRHKAALEAEKFAKGSQRDLAQAIANGGVATALALLHATRWGTRHEPALARAFAGALATANADTWATEIGTLSRHAPRLITSGRRVPPGTSGGVTALGLLATTAGAATLGTAFALARRGTRTHRGAASILVASIIGGVLGSLVDSFLGATVQAMYHCPRCDVETERRRHSCGSATIPLRGLPWLDNDAVNALSTLAGAAAAVAAACGAGCRESVRSSSDYITVM